MFLLSRAWFVCTTRHWGLLHAAWGLVTLEVMAGGAVWWNLLHYQCRLPVCAVFWRSIGFAALWCSSAGIGAFASFVADT